MLQSTQRIPSLNTMFIHRALYVLSRLDNAIIKYAVDIIVAGLFPVE